ncbi:DUF2339 domain-containing protein [Salipaludibacillus sp. CF4.18]|uniref:DUF2339 domain-containing protein n=1 Tax=Salipaludibacillus sp. CF4.18 TaxID=3373081 RepID=UPI003EE4E7B9
MDDIKERLRKLKAKQDKLAGEFDVVVKEYESSDVLSENEKLRKDTRDYLEKLRELKEKFHHTESENRKLRTALHDQILDEKTNILKVSKEKLHMYFGTKIEPTRDQLSDFEKVSKTEIEKLKERISKLFRDDEESMKLKLQGLSNEVDDMILKEQALLAKEEQDLLHSFSGTYEKLAKEDVSEDVIQKRMKQNRLEMKIGLNVINKLGILLIIFGVAAAFRYSYTTWFNDYLKGGMFSVLGILMLIGGESLYRRDRQTFSLGVIGGGIAVLYGSVFFSYFLLEIIGLTVALLISMLITVTAVILSLRYESKTICTFGLVGGYIPLVFVFFRFRRICGNGSDDLFAYTERINFMDLLSKTVEPRTLY